MAFDQILTKGATSQIVEVSLRNSSTGAGLTGVAYTAVTASYVREGGTRQAITLAAGSAGDAYSSGKWAEVDSTNCPGLYQFHLPNAAFVTGVNAVTFFIKATGAIDKPLRFVLIDANLRDATALGLSRLDDSVTSRQASGAVALQANQHVIADTVPAVTLAASQPNYAPAKAGDAMTLAANQHVIADTVPAVQLAASQPNYAPAKAGDAMTLTAGAITSIQNGLATLANQTTLLSYVDTEIAAILSAVDTEIQAILAKVNPLPAAPAAVSDVQVTVDLTTTNSKIDAVQGDVTRVKAAVYDSATVAGDVITLSNGETQTVTSGGRVTSV